MNEFFRVHWIQTVLLLIAWNMFVFLLYGTDKRKAKKGSSRIPEKTLLLYAACFGSAGALLGMRLFHHKTKHTKFRIWVPLFLLIHIAMLLWVFLG